MPDGERTDIAALTGRMTAGDEDAYRMFHELYFQRLLRYLLIVTGGREEAAREALQLALLRVVRHIRRFDAEAVFWSWLTVLARSALVDEERKRHRYLAFLDRFFRREQIEAATNVEADGRLQELLTANLDTLPWEERDPDSTEILRTRVGEGNRRRRGRNREVHRIATGAHPEEIEGRHPYPIEP